MKDDLDFVVFLFLGQKKISLSVNKKKDFKLIFKNEILIDNFSDQSNFEILDNFLNENILKIEKNLNNFVKDMNVIVDTKDFFTLTLSVKKNNDNRIINSKFLNYLLKDAKNQCEKTIKNKQIVHFIIDNYVLDGTTYDNLPSEIKCKNFSLDLRFICLSMNFVKRIEESFRKYQISINQLLSADYLESFFSEKESDFFTIAFKILDGHNKNEVRIINKTTKNKGFFEKFFDFFS